MFPFCTLILNKVTYTMPLPSKSNPHRDAKYTTNFILSLIPSMTEFANNPDSLVFNEWIANNDLDQIRIGEFAKESKIFANSLQACKLKIASRREKLALHGKISEGIVKHTQHVYDKELFESMIALKKAGREEVNVAPPVINVHLSGRSGQVKAKKSKA